MPFSDFRLNHRNCGRGMPAMSSSAAPPIVRGRSISVASVGSRDYIDRYPVATKRVLRAILKATDICAADPPRVARRMVDRGFTPRYEFALQTLSDVPYKSWRDYNIEDTVRFYALRMREAGLIKSAPQKIIAQGTDWRFLNELKRELKA